MTNEPKSKPDARAIVARLSKQSKTFLERELIAPLLPGRRIRTRLDGLIYEFKPKGNFVGWGRFRPINEREAEPLGEALPWQRGAYLELFPALRVILLWPDSDAKRPGTWWALPFNDSDARQRFGFNPEPLPVFLCDPTNGAERFERILMRVDGNALWFDSPDTRADPTHAEWLGDVAAQTDVPDRFLPGLAGSERLALLFWHIRQFELALQPQRHSRTEMQRQRQAQIPRQNRRKQQEWLRHEVMRSQLEDRLRHALAKADATLHSYSEIPRPDGSPGHLVVEWSEHGQTRRYRSTLDPSMTIVSSGICLSGRDRDFDLTSLVSVMTDSPW